MDSQASGVTGTAGGHSDEGQAGGDSGDRRYWPGPGAGLLAITVLAAVLRYRHTTAI